MNPIDGYFRDFLFSPQNAGPRAAGIQAHIVDANFYFINIENPTEEPITMPRKIRLGVVTDYKEEGCYYTESDNASLAVQPPSQPGCTRAIPETILPNGVTVYGACGACSQIQAVVERYPDLWTDTGTSVQMPKEEYLSIPLVEDWQSKGSPPRFAR